MKIRNSRLAGLWLRFGGPLLIVLCITSLLLPLEPWTRVVVLVAVVLAAFGTDALADVQPSERNEV